MEDKSPVKKSAFTLRIIWALLGLFFIITVASQIYIRFYNPLRTETAMLYSTPDTYVFEAVHIRNERLVRYGGADVISYAHPDGSKLGRNSIVAQSYRSVDDILLQKRIDELTERVRVLEGAETLESTDNFQLESYLNQIMNRHTALLGQISAGDYSAIDTLKNEYISLQCKKRVLRGEEIGYREQIGALNSEIASLRARISASPRDVIIDEAGYFVSVVDGYEGSLNFDRIYSLQKDDIERIIREPRLEVGEGIIGKMIDGYKWRFVGVLNTERTRSLYEGAAVELRTGGSTQAVRATVLRRIRLDDGNSIFIFECDTLTPELASRRVSQFNLVLNQYKGIRIPTIAVHVNDENQQGVFVKHGTEIIFKRINVIRTENNYFLVEDTTNVAGFISLYDSVVTRGRDLYDGKIVP
ncbi:MAG: hypothetical protein LBC82_03780 [Oscillospiraceae bacterium]|nr:hypothetical protein [Oscillospiraceae bacterium]